MKFAILVLLLGMTGVLNEDFEDLASSGKETSTIISSSHAPTTSGSGSNLSTQSTINTSEVIFESTFPTTTEKNSTYLAWWKVALITVAVLLIIIGTILLVAYCYKYKLRHRFYQKTNTDYYSRRDKSLEEKRWEVPREMSDMPIGEKISKPVKNKHFEGPL